MPYSELAVILIQLALRLRTNLQQNKEWTQEEEAKFKAESDALFAQPQWQKEQVPSKKGTASVVAPAGVNRRLSELLELSKQSTLPADLSAADAETINLIRQGRAALQ